MDKCQYFTSVLYFSYPGGMKQSALLAGRVASKPEDGKGNPSERETIG